MVCRPPPVVRFHDRARTGALQPCECLGIAAQVRIPKRRGQRKNHTVMIRVARFAFARQGTVGEGRMLRVMQHQLIFRRAVERRINSQAANTHYAEFPKLSASQQPQITGKFCASGFNLLIINTSA